MVLARAHAHAMWTNVLPSSETASRVQVIYNQRWWGRGCWVMRSGKPIGPVRDSQAPRATRLACARIQRSTFNLNPHANNLSGIEAPVLTFLLAELLYNYFACRLKFAGVDSHHRGSNVRRTERKRCCISETKNRVETETECAVYTYIMRQSYLIRRAKLFSIISSCMCAQVCDTPSFYSAK
jgi:hypothetical protein